VKPIVLLGPQRRQPTLLPALAAFGAEGPLAAVTAGWEEREDEVERLEAHVGRTVLNLRLYRRAEEAMLCDWELAAAYRERRARLTELGDHFRARLVHAHAAARAMRRRRGTEAILGPEREDALAALRALDERHLRRLEEVHAEFEERWRPGERKAVAERREEVRRLLADCGAVALAGGNVAVLSHRLRLFGMAPLLRDRAVFAWSAGAMAAGERIVLFHENPPQGPGIPEVFGSGLGLFPGLLPLPHARTRLRLENRRRVSLFAERFAPLRCVALDEGDGAAWDGARWTAAAGGARLLRADGTVGPFPPAGPDPSPATAPAP